MKTTSFDWKNAPPGGTFRRAVRALFCLLIISACLVGAASAASEYFSGEGTADSPYLISSASDLRNLSTLLSTDNTERDNYLRKHYKLTQDIALTGGEWTPIAGFSGTFDGAGHTISGMTITQTNNGFLGLFGYTGSSATIIIKNLNVKGSINIILTSEGYTPSVLYFGGIVGQNIRATIENCSSDVTITGNFKIGDSKNIAVYAGGIVGEGQSGSTIRNSSAFGDIMLTAPDAGNSAEYNVLSVGGIAGIGISSAYIYDSYAVGDMTVTATQNTHVYTGGLIGCFVSGGGCENSYATGNVEGSSYSELYVGGLVGKMGEGIHYVTNSYATGDVKANGAASATTYVGGLVGYMEAGTKSTPLGINPNRISYCYALNEKITANGGTCYLNRVVGGVNKADNSYTVDLISNHAWVNMKLNETTVTDGTKSNNNGADIKSSEVWNQPFGFGSFTAENGWEVYTGNSNFQMPVRADVVKPVGAEAVHLKVEQYTVTFHTNGGSAVDSEKVIKGETVEKPEDPIRDGYAFGGWYSDSDLTTPYDFNTPVNSNLDLYAKWSTKYIVTFHSNGGSDVESQIVAADSLVEKPYNPYRDGYQFAGWYSDSGLTNLYDFTTPVNSNLDLYANWTEITYTVSFYSDPGVLFTEQTVVEGQTATEPSPAPTKEGNTFLGWYYEDFYDFSSPVYWDLDLFAQWEPSVYDISFDANGGTGEMANITVEHGDSFTLPGSTFTAPVGHEFAVWYDQSDWGSGTSYTEGEEFETVTSDMTFYANWTPITYYITFNTDGGTLVAEKQVGYNETIPVIDEPTKEGYTFTGWDPALPERMPAHNLTVTANWTIKTFNVTFDSKGGTKVSDQIVNYSEKVEEPATSKEGSTFDGWYDGAERFDFNSGITKDTDLTARWTAKTYTVTWNDGSENPQVDSLQYGSSITKANPTKDGHTFKQWLPAVPSKMPAKDLTFTALWTPDTHTVTFDNNTGSGVMEPVTVSHDEVYILPSSTFTAPADSTFNGWNISGTNYKAGANITITGNVVAKAEWKEVAADNVTVHFNTDGGYPIPESAEIPINTAVAKPENHLDKEGSEFTGWYTEDGTLWNFDTPVSKEMTLTAGWEINPKVTGITVLPQKIVVVNGTTQQFTAEVFGVGDYSKTVIWSVSPFAGTDSISSTIDHNGLLKVADGDVRKNINVTATIGDVSGYAVVSVEEKPAPVVPAVEADAEETDGTVTVTFIPNELANSTVTQIQGKDAKITDTNTGVSTTVTFADEPETGASTVTGKPSAVVITFPETPVETGEETEKKFELGIDMGTNVTFDLPVIDTALRPEIDALIGSENESVAMITAENVDGINDKIADDGVKLTFIVDAAWYDANKDRLNAYHVKSDGTVTELDISAEKKGDVYRLTVTGDDFSSYVLAVDTTVAPVDPTPDDPVTPGGGGGSVPTVVPTVTPTVAPTDAPTSVPTEIPTGPVPTEPGKSPAPVLGMILGGLSAAVVLRRK